MSSILFIIWLFSVQIGFRDNDRKLLSATNVCFHFEAVNIDHYDYFTPVKSSLNWNDQV